MLHIIQGKGWTAEVLVSDEAQAAGVRHVQCETTGISREKALEGVQYVFALFTKGRRTWVRCAPEADSDRDFATKIETHRGFARFSCSLDAGEHQPMASMAPVAFISEARAS